MLKLVYLMQKHNHKNFEQNTLKTNYMTLTMTNMTSDNKIHLMGTGDMAVAQEVEWVVQ